jgi:hypothetical protein
VITEFPKLLDGLTIQMSSNLQVSLVLLKEHVKVLYEHGNRAFTISTPSQNLGEKMTGLCGIKVFLSHLNDNRKLFVFSGKCGKNGSNNTSIKSSKRLQTSSLWRLQELPKGLIMIDPVKIITFKLQWHFNSTLVIYNSLQVY